MTRRVGFRILFQLEQLGAGHLTAETTAENLLIFNFPRLKMSKDRYEANLERLQGELQRYLEENHLNGFGIASGPARRSTRR